MPATRSIWKGHVSFGLVNIPVTLYSAEQRNDLQFHLLDDRTTDRVRYQRVNEDTGEEVPWDHIVKGYEYDDQGYVLLSNEELKEVRAELTKTIEIEDFVSQSEIEPLYFDKPYFLEPGKGGAKAYALLRSALKDSERLGIARVVIRAREHLAALMVRGDCLILELLRFPQELRDPKFLDLPGESTSVSKREHDMAMQLIESMTVEWDPARYHDDYRESLMNYIEEKVKRGDLSPGGKQEDEQDDKPRSDGNVVDLMDYLKRSVEKAKKKPSANSKKKKSAKAAPKKSAPKAKKKSSAKSSSRKAS